MPTLDGALREDMKWYKEFHSIPVINKCDAGCGKEATDWFGNTSCATCGETLCVKVMQDDYNKSLHEEDEGY